MDTNSMKKEQGATIIELDKEKIKTDIALKGVYDEVGVKLKKWEGEEETEYFVGSLVAGKTSYLGVLNSKLKRQNFGLNKYENGDMYFGYFDNDIKAKHGCYFFAPLTENGYINSELYYGFWTNNKKDHHGMYIWTKEKEGIKNFEETDFDAYVGDIEDSSYKKGCYLSKNEDSYFVYYGNFDPEGKKKDMRAFFYSSKADRVFVGEFFDDRFVKGHVSYFDESGSITAVLYAEFNDNDDVTKVMREEDIKLEIRTKVSEDTTLFRNLILEDDYFGLIYSNLNEIKTFLEDNMNDIAVLDDYKGYPRIMKLGAAYNDVKIFVKLEKSFNII